MQREVGLMNDISGCFPLFWTQCKVCGREFKLEKGWIHFSIYGDPRYYCKKCCKNKQEVVEKLI